jgi:hypothetical protein
MPVYGHENVMSNSNFMLEGVICHTLCIFFNAVRCNWIYTLLTCELILAKVHSRKAGQVSDRCWNLACTTHNFTKVYRWIYTLRTCKLIFMQLKVRQTRQIPDRIRYCTWFLI